MSNSAKTGRPVLGLVLGILGILCALFLAFLTGVIGGGIALVLGLAALLLGIFASKSGSRGVGAIVTGAIAIFLAVIITIVSVSTFSTLQSKAAESGNTPLMAKYLGRPELGFIGLLMSIPSDEGSANELVEELNYLNSH